jgi:twinkle protein
MAEHEDSHVIFKGPCPKCGSKDNLAHYSDGHTYCFGHGCNYYEHATGSIPESPRTRSNHKEAMSTSEALASYFSGEVTNLKARNINQETAERYGYRVGTIGDKTVQLAPYYKDGRIVGCKARGPNKDFFAIGDMKKPSLFGSQLADKGRLLVVTEGEIDAMSVSMACDGKYLAVSVPTGASGACKAFKENLEYFTGFESVVIMFDMDDVGQAAAKECAEVLPPGKAKIAHITGAKDANELLQQHKVAEIINAVFTAKVYRPDGIVTIAEVREKALQDPEMGLPWFLPTLSDLTYGRRYSELLAFGAGTGVGKTDFLIQQIEFDLNTLRIPVGVFFLEQGPPETLKRIAGKSVGKLFHIPDGKSTKAELEAAIDAIEQNAKLYMYDSWGATEWEAIRNKIRYLNHSEGVRVFYIDHLTALAAEAEDERKALETIMSQMAKLCNELDVLIHLVSHLASPEGKSHEEGGRVTIKQFKGSRSIGFWCHGIYAIERDQQDEDQTNQALFRVLKDRNTGRATGKTIKLYYDADTGLQAEAPAMAEEF